ncbi:MAG: hypothetical protein ACJ72V_20575 [Nitrososphaeraceae archaeon]
MSVAMIGMSAAWASLQYADGKSNDKAMRCRYQLSDVSKCSQKKDIPFILPFP